MTTLLAIITLAATEAAQSSGWISGDVLVSILSVLAGGGGLIYGRHIGKKAAVDELEKRQISGEVTTKLPQPFSIEQTAYQAQMKENAKDHENLFARMARLEQQFAAIDAKVDAKFDAIKEQLSETKDMVRQLFERICKKR